MGRRAPVSLRVNPDVDAGTHPYISTGLKGNKFGVAHDQALAVYRRPPACRASQVVGIDCHIGSQITQIAPYLDALDRLLDLVEAVEADGIPIHHVDVGGGLGITYTDEAPPAADCWWPAAGPHGRTRPRPPRAAAGARPFAGGQCRRAADRGAGAQARAPSKNFCIVDAAMNDLVRPAMYQAWMGIVPCHRARMRRVSGTWWARCANRATGWAATVRWRCSRAMCWPCCRPAPTAWPWPATTTPARARPR
jgi:diaminopimelate decarboxylase